MIKKAINIIIVFLILFISSGVTFNLHYCKGQLEKMALFTTPKSCHEVMKSCCVSKDQLTCHQEDHDDNCCKNESEFIKFNQQYVVKQEVTVDVRLPLVAVISVLFIDNVFGTDSYSKDYLNYKPPLIFEDKPVLFQSFLC